MMVEAMIKLNDILREELSSSDRVELYKLTNLALKQMPNSPKQKEIIKKLNLVRIKNGMKPLRENFLGVDLNESTLTISISNIVRELFPKEFFYTFTQNDVERVKSTIGDLVRTLNNFYKQHNVKVKFVDTNYKFKMYSKENTMIKLTDLLGEAVKGGVSSAGLNEADDTYFKSYTHAIEAAEAMALKRGYTIDSDEMFTKVGVGSKKPSVGKTTRVSLELLKNGKPQRKMLHIQVYGMNNGYELNAYIN